MKTLLPVRCSSGYRTRRLLIPDSRTLLMVLLMVVFVLRPVQVSPHGRRGVLLLQLVRMDDPDDVEALQKPSG